MFGHSDVLKKSSDRKWLSLRSFLVLMLSIGMVTSMLLSARLFGSKLIVASTSSKVPVTGVKKCVIENLMVLCALSTCQLVASMLAVVNAAKAVNKNAVIVKYVAFLNMIVGCFGFNLFNIKLNRLS